MDKNANTSNPQRNPHASTEKCPADDWPHSISNTSSLQAAIRAGTITRIYQGKEAKAQQESKQQEKYRFQLQSFDDIKPKTCDNYLVKGWLPKEGLAVVWGTPKSGKSFWTTDLMVHVASGMQYRGCCVTQGAVVIVVSEGSGGIGARMQALRQHYDLNRIPLYIITRKVNLIADFQDLIDDIQEQIGAPAAVVLDTLSRTLVGNDSSSQDMSAYVAGCDAIRDAFHCCVVVVHHCGWDDTRFRGNTHLLGALDTNIHVARVDETVVCIVEENRDGPSGTTTASVLKSVTVGVDDDGDEIRSCVVEEADAPEKRTANGRPQKIDIAYDLLVDEVARKGIELPRGGNYPDKLTLGITKEQWRDRCYACGITDGGQEAKKKAFQRAWKKLVGTEVGACNEHVWIIRDKRDIRDKSSFVPV